jgi:hypothetical protein
MTWNKKKKTIRAAQEELFGGDSGRDSGLQTG